MGRVLLVRHGQASADAADYDVLSPLGWEQGRILGSALAAKGMAAPLLVRGDLRRHRETLEALVEGAGWDVPDDDAVVDAGWDEFDHLAVLARLPWSFEGEEPTRQEFQAWFEEATLAWTRSDGEGFAEPWAAFLARCEQALARTAELAGRRTVLVVTSGGPVAACASGLLDIGDLPEVRARVWNRLNTVVVNSSLTKVVVGRRGTTLVGFNEHAHLEEAALSYR